MIKATVDMKELQRKLEAKKKKAIDRANVKKALRPGALMGLEGAKNRVPVDTGRLRDSLKVRVSGNNLLVQTSEDHATYNEFKNRSYMRATIEGDKDQMIDSIKKEYKKIVIE